MCFMFRFKDLNGVRFSDFSRKVITGTGHERKRPSSHLIYFSLSTERSLVFLKCDAGG